MDIGQRIKERRKLLKMSAEELGAKLGKNRATIYRYENGDIENLPLDILEPIAEVLDTTPAYLMGWQKAITENPIEIAEQHAEMIMDADFAELFDDFRKLTPEGKKMAKKIIHSLVDADV